MKGENGACAVTAKKLKELCMIRRLLSKENLYAVLVCLALILILILTSDQAPQWIYQGF